MGSAAAPDGIVATVVVPTWAGAGAGEVEILGALVTLNACVAASCRITFWRSCCEHDARPADWRPGDSRAKRICNGSGTASDEQNAPLSSRRWLPPRR